MGETEEAAQSEASVHDTLSPTPMLVPDVPPTPSRPRASMGIVELALDESQTVRAVGVVYGLEHTVRGEGYEAVLFLDKYNQRIKVLEYRATDVQALEWGVRASHDPHKPKKIVRITDTLHLGEMYVSDAALELVGGKVETISGPGNLFDEQGSLIAF